METEPKLNHIILVLKEFMYVIHSLHIGLMQSYSQMIIYTIEKSKVKT